MKEEDLIREQDIGEKKFNIKSIIDPKTYLRIFSIKDRLEKCSFNNYVYLLTESNRYLFVHT